MKRKPDFFSRLSWRLLLVLLLACLGTVGFVIWAVELGKPLRRYAGRNGATSSGQYPWLAGGLYI